MTQAMTWTQTETGTLTKALKDSDVVVGKGNGWGVARTMKDAGADGDKVTGCDKDRGVDGSRISAAAQTLTWRVTKVPAQAVTKIVTDDDADTGIGDGAGAGKDDTGTGKDSG